LAGDGGCVHESALRYGEHCHAILVGAGRSRVTLDCTDTGRRAAGAYACGSACGDRDGACARGKLERTRFKSIQSTLILEEDNLAICFAAGLESDADLTHCRVANEATLHVHMAFAQCPTQDETRLTDRREYGVRIALVEERGAFARVFKQTNRIGVFTSV